MSQDTPEQELGAAAHEKQLLDSQVHQARLELAASHDVKMRLGAAIVEQRKRRAAYMARFDDGSVFPSPPLTLRPRHG